MKLTAIMSSEVAQPARQLPPCLYCGHTLFHPWVDEIQDRLRHVPGRWAFQRCQQCGSALLDPHPSPEELSGFYPPVYGFAPELGGTNRRNWRAWLEYRLFFKPQFDAQANRVLRGIGWKPTPGLRLLDLGCGRGLRLLAFQRRGFEVHGMDFQQEDVAYVQSQLGLPAICTDFDGLMDRFAVGSFDVITAFHVLEHVPDVQQALRTCFQLLRPGGWLVAAIPMVDGIQSRLFKRRWIGVTEAPRHLSLPSQEGLLRATRSAGFASMKMGSDGVLNCAGAFGLSCFPGASTTRTYGAGGRMVLRSLGALCALLALPWCLVEYRLTGKPSLGMLFAQTPVSHE